MCWTKTCVTNYQPLPHNMTEEQSPPINCLHVFWCAAARMLELELEQRASIKFLVKLGKSGNEIREMLVQVYRDNAMKKTAV